MSINWRREGEFLLALWKANLLAAMEYRVAFLSQIIGMILNNALYFLFWVLFFQRFHEVRGWQLNDMVLLFGLVATGFGLAVFFFGNALSLCEVILEGRLDYYLSLPRPVLLHTLASGSVSSGMGDFTYGVISFALLGNYSLDAIARFVIGVLLAMLIFLAVMVIVHSLTFWLGSASAIANAVMNAMITFSIYPSTLFDGSAKLILLTILPAAFVGAIPAEFVRNFAWSTFGQLLLAAVIFLGLALVIFQRGLRRYESGSAIQTRA